MNKDLYLAGHVNHPTNIWLRDVYRKLYVNVYIL